MPLNPTTRDRLFGLALCALWVALAPRAAAGQTKPIHAQTRLDLPGDRGIFPQETIRIVSRWDSAGYLVRADFSALDGGGTEIAVADSGNGLYLIQYSTGAMTGLGDAAAVRIPVTAIKPRDPTQSETWQNFMVCRNVTGALPEHVDSGLLRAQTVYRPGDSLLVWTTWRMPRVDGSAIEADYRALAPRFQPIPDNVSDPDSVGEGIYQYIIRYKIPATGLVEQQNDIPLALIAKDALCSAIRHEGIFINLRTDEIPTPISHELISPVDRGVREGDYLEILSRWDASGYRIRADFTALDGGSGGNFSVLEGDSGQYTIHYMVGSMADLPDRAITVPITAIDDLGDSFTDPSLQICRNRSTPPPVHVASALLSARDLFHPGDEIMIGTRWESPAGLPTNVEVDFRALVPGFLPGQATVTADTTWGYLITYKLPGRDNLGSDGLDLPVIISARDALCSVARYDGIHIGLDKTAPSKVPIFDTLPEETGSSVLRVSGVADEASYVALLRNDTYLFRVPVDTATYRFEADIEMVKGLNKITAWSEDDLGNKTPIGLSHYVRYVPDQITTYPTPFTPGDEFVVHDNGGMSAADLTVYNLQGDRVIEFRRNGTFLEATFKWDGKDLDGDLAQPGYYLVRVRRTSLTGKTSEEVRPMLFRND